jgi:anti-sigma regulatory factor (Ser/Thr protein kinase)
VGPRGPLGHLSRLGFALRSARDVDEIARFLIKDLVELPGVCRVGMALTEGGGRHLRFVANERVSPEGLEWCHIDSYDDVPLTAVVRTGEPVLGNLDDLERGFADVVSRQREVGVAALAAWPLPGTGSPIGGILLFFDEPQAFPEAQRGLFAATARRVAEAVRRIRVTSGRGPGDASPDDPELIGGGQRAGVLLESDPRAPGAARRFLRERLAGWGVEEDAVETAQLCLSELATNVVMHARTTSELTLHLEDGVLTVVVRDLGGSSRAGDPGLTTPAGDREDPMRISGRGLMLVEALADRWGSEIDASGTTAWFALELDADPASPARTG